MSRVRVKICGMTRAADADAAVARGADAIGFVFWPASPRAVTADVARAIASRLPALVHRVGVFVNASPDHVRDVATHVGLDVVQLHGDEPLDAFRELGVRLMRSVTLEDEAAFAIASALPPSVLPLVDAMDRVRRGGTGQVANWTGAASLAAVRPIALAGGLTPANVAEAIRRVRPWAIDVSSGVEDAPGLKSVGKLDALFAAVAAAQAEEL